ncbi:hypothetical protein [Solibacillus cecembensis]|uniref:hypothetical protein n=1 Tax=Solibacillus cecembensis TaxID=459347 RepID=UPI003D04354B
MANKSRLYGEDVIKEIIYRYIDENNIAGEIEYSNVRDFALKLWENKDHLFTQKMYYQLIDKNTGETSDKIYKNIKLSDDFWRKPQYQGRQQIDAFNDVLSKTVARTSKREFYIPNVEFVIDKFKHNITQLKLNLKPLEAQLKKSILQEEKLENRIKNLIEDNSNLKNQKNDLYIQNQKLQDALYKMFEYSASRDIPLENQLNTGKGRTKRVEEALKDVFGDNISSFYLNFKENTHTNNQSNIKDFNTFKENKAIKSYDDEYDFE